MHPKTKISLLAFPSVDDASMAGWKRDADFLPQVLLASFQPMKPQGFVQPKNAEIQYCAQNFIGIEKIFHLQALFTKESTVSCRTQKFSVFSQRQKSPPLLFPGEKLLLEQRAGRNRSEPATEVSVRAELRCVAEDVCVCLAAADPRTFADFTLIKIITSDWKKKCNRKEEWRDSCHVVMYVRWKSCCTLFTYMPKSFTAAGMQV